MKLEPTRPRRVAAALFAAGLALPAAAAQPGTGTTASTTADSTPAQSNGAALERLRASVARAEARLRHTRHELDRARADLDRQGALLDEAMRRLRAAGPGPTSAAQDQAAAATDATAADTAAPPPEQTSAPITGTKPAERREARVLQTSPLQSVGGVLTPSGTLVIDPSLEYDYSADDQLSLNGFTILPGITFGQLLLARVRQSMVTPALTLRYGLTDRLELSARVPFVYAYQETVTQSILQQSGGGTTVGVLAPSAHAASLGDIQFGASYQFNQGGGGVPIVVGNLIYKTATGTSPFSVPVYTTADPNGGIISGIQKKVPTGTGFPALEPSITLLYPTAPGILFANLLYIHNFGSTVHVQDPGGGPAVAADAKPGDAVAATFGIGFALNDETTFTLSYQQEHVFGATFNHAAVKGSTYDFGTFNFGIGYQLSKSTTINLGVGIGAGPNAPVAKVLIDVPVRF
ncbi:MAG TPA: hypothetical protein PLV07_04630 [Acidiphilium sp.]|jgi:hypothetical protein|uniref:hypothetical protein n=1 Tax=unclassified Acidiphilium TaxID=2617493 RepID=UPI000BD3422D|nr:MULTISPECIES: hypothetical protein [unclassified Acidiphilium]OYV56520.1 MAG: hypothetical protein B7Z76_06350 [Acidiphilium sp. 20-67-58]HQT59789.1 hypothetical protein [Acidiphilium sp.]HQU10847.1 hypothetical protein [Acidiphilium sp.]